MGELALGPPEVGDGPELWRIARDSRKLDLNPAYVYLLWCRDFTASSVVARPDADAGGRGGDRHPALAGFVMGYRRPEATGTLLVWQVAVDRPHRGTGLALRMLDHLAARLEPAGVRYLEATVTPDNEPSARLFTAFARERGAELDKRELFPARLFPEEHQPEILFRIGPLR